MTHPLVQSMAALGIVLAAGGALAHDTWVMPRTFQPPAGEPLSAVVSAGDGLKPLTVPKRERVIALEIVDAEGRRSYRGWNRGATSVKVSFDPPRPGISCLAYRSVPFEIRIAPRLVDQYLAEIQPGADILAAWQRQRARKEPWRESYAKEAKTCLRRGSDETGWPQLATLGHELEIVPTQDPTRLTRGSGLTVQLLHQGRPAADIALRLFNERSEERTARTDAQGRAHFEPSQAGRYLIAATVLTPPGGKGQPWTSRFATLGLEVAP